MSDANKFMNTYVDITVSTLHDQINTILQLKTQAKLASDLITEKDGVIATLKEELTNASKNQQEFSKATENATKWEQEYNAMKNKVSHMDTLTNQYNDLRNQFVDKNRDIDRLNSLVESMKQQLETANNELTSVKNELQAKDKELIRLTPQPKKQPSKKNINTKIIEMPFVEQEDKTDDF